MKKISFWIWSFVCAFHITLLLFFCLSASAIIKKPVLKKLTVRTFSPSSEKKLSQSVLDFLDEPIAVVAPPQPLEIEETISIPEPPQATPIAPPPAPTSVKKKPAVKPTTEVKKPTVKPTAETKKPAPPKPAKKTASSPKPAPKKTEQDKALALMKQTLAALEKSSTVSKSSISLDNYKKLDTLGSEQLSFAAAAAAAYQDEIAAYLKHLLELPELGDVKLRLTLKRDGSVSHVAIVSSTSDKNAQYVEKKIPSLSFPPFGERLKNEKEHTFPVTLTSKY